VLDHLGEVFDVAFRSDGKQFLTASFQLRLWDTATSKELARTFAVQSVVTRAAFSPDGKTTLAALVEDDAARLFDSETGKSIASPLRHQSMVVDARFSPDGMLVLTASADRTARLWDAATGLPVGPPWKNDRAVPNGRFTADGRSVLLPQDGCIARWPAPTPMEGTRERIRLAIEVATRYTLDPDGGVGWLGPVFSPDPKDPSKAVPTKDPWPAARQRLLELGGPPGSLRR
jgi:WD40 repeat protein